MQAARATSRSVCDCVTRIGARRLGTPVTWEVTQRQGFWSPVPADEVDSADRSQCRRGCRHSSPNCGQPLHERWLLDSNADIAAPKALPPHSFGRTVATENDEVYDAEAASTQLGRTSTTITQRHYINRKLVVPDFRAATERLAPPSGETKARMDTVRTAGPNTASL